jgi:hypothetical protein
MEIHMQVTFRKTLKYLIMKIKVALKLASCSNSQLLVKGDHYVNSMTGNAHFAAPSIADHVAICKTDVTNLRAAINAPMSDTKMDNIRIARDALIRDLTVLGTKVEEVANDPSLPDSKRLEIVHSAGMEAKDQVHPAKHVFSAENSNISGTVHLSAPGGAKAHDWEWTTDVINFTGRVSLTPTTKASTDIQNLKKGTEYAFFHKAIIPQEDTDWEGPVILLVQ